MEMERSCEFCLILRPIVYCKADAAHLCLCCDAKVHSANALSNRHPRTLVCESCRCRPAYVQCAQHMMFMCRGCDRSQHDLSSQHQKKVISSYMGCPSAKDFAALWGLDLNELDSSTFQNKAFSSVSGLTSTLCTLPKIGSSSGQFTERPVGTETGFEKANQWEDMSYILQQILDLKRHQLNQGSATNSFVRVEEATNLFSFNHNSKWRLHDDLDQHLQHSLDLGSDLQCLDSPSERMTTESFPFGFTQPDGDFFWQCKSPIQGGQLWPQNMQDLGVCDGPECFNDLSMPEVDLTFKSIEDIFGGEQELTRALLDEKDTFCSSVEKDLSIEKSDNGYERSVEDVSAASSVYISQSVNPDKDIGSSDNFNQCLETKDCANSIQPSYSALSFSRLSVESSAPEYIDSELSSSLMRQQHACNSSDLDSTQVDCKESVIMRYKEKKRIRRNEKRARYPSRKSRSDVKRLVSGQFMKGEGYISDGVNVSRSF